MGSLRQRKIYWVHPNDLCQESGAKVGDWDMLGVASVCVSPVCVFFLLETVHLVGANSSTQHFHGTVESAPKGNTDTPFQSLGR